MTHCVYYAYGKHLHRRYGQQLTRRDLFIYESLRRLTGHKPDEPTFLGIVPAMIRMMAEGHGLWPLVQYQTNHNKDALLQEAKKRGVMTWLLTQLAPSGKAWDEAGLRPGMFFVPGNVYEAGENQDGGTCTMAIQLKPGW